jgi:conjugal transfer ATP-binding protein TraC
MVDRKLTISDRYEIMKRKIGDRVRSTLVDDTPPSTRIKSSGSPTMEAMKAIANRYQLSDLLPYESYDSETEIYYNRDTLGFLLYALPATGLTPESLQVLNGFFNQEHKANTLIQISIIADPNIENSLDPWRESKLNPANPELRGIFDVLSKNRVAYLQKGKFKSLFSDQSFLPRNLHLVISYVVSIPVGINPIDANKETIEQLRRTKEATIGTLRSASISAKNMEPDLFINILNGVMNPSKDRVPNLYYDKNKLIKDQIFDSDTSIYFDSGVSSVTHKDESFSIIPYHVRQFPKRWGGFNNGDLIGSFTNNIMRIPCPFIATLTVNCPDQVSSKGKAKAKSLRATQMAGSAVAKYVPVWQQRKQDWNFASEKMENGNKMLEAFYQIILITPEGTEQQAEQSLKGVYANKGWTLSKSRYIPVQSLLGAIPMGVCQDVRASLKSFGHFDSRLSWTCTNIAPWISEWKGTKNPMMTFLGRRGQVAYFDPFDNDKGNFNISCMATSGAGKSFFTQEWIFSCLGGGGRSFVIDSGHSYKNLCYLLSGTYIEFGIKGSNLCLNPFSGIDESDREYFDDQLPLLKQLISQMASPDKGLTSKQSAVMEKAIMRAWLSKKSKATITTVADCLRNEGSEDDGRMYETAKDLAIMLHSYTDYGAYGRYFEGEANVDMSNDFVVLELDALKKTPELQSVVLLILMMQITQAMYLSGNKKQRKLCIIDEAWKLMGSGSAGEFIEEGYRVARKHGGSFMTITQKVSDYYKSPTAQAAYMNSDFSVFLRQKPEELTSAIAKGHIDNSDGKVDILRSLETVGGKYSELAIQSPDGLAVLRFLVDPVTEKIYSTKAEEVHYIRECMDNGMSIFEAVESLLAQTTSR